MTDTFVFAAVYPHELCVWRKRIDLFLKTVDVVAIKKLMIFVELSHNLAPLMYKINCLQTEHRKCSVQPTLKIRAGADSG
jgi:hypothetical protein